MEDDPVFNAGTGSHPAIDGHIEMDAAVMTQDGRFGAVACVRDVRNPVLLAERVMIDTDHLLLSGEGAMAFADRAGLERCASVPTERAKARLEQVKKTGSKYFPKLNRMFGLAAEPTDDSVTGTVGAVAMDKYGKVAAAVSTGGVAGRLPGRVGDSAVIGAGVYAGAGGAVCCTGHGESIMKMLLAKDIVDRMTTLPGTAALALAMAEARRRKAQCGAVGFDSRGGVCYGHTTPQMAYGYKIADRVFLFTDNKKPRA
jgi:isoaspartyl peptidase/L-asparaginase-like protein (Ntn-hydrolase superfamily)